MNLYLLYFDTISQIYSHEKGVYKKIIIIFTINLNIDRTLKKKLY
jgi:hypothetical protein